MLKVPEASVGAAAKLAELLAAGPAAALVAATVLSVHCAVMVGGCRLANRALEHLGRRSKGSGGPRPVSLPELLIASNANVGGVGTAVAMAGAMGWTRLIAPAAACGALGYAAATLLGVGLHALLRGPVS